MIWLRIGILGEPLRMPHRTNKALVPMMIMMIM
jgi:hypothetical protein